MPIQREPRRAVHDHVYRAGVAIIPNLSSTSASSNGVQGDTGRYSKLIASERQQRRLEVVDDLAVDRDHIGEEVQVSGLCATVGDDEVIIVGHLLRLTICAAMKEQPSRRAAARR
jgi:hypothetical protein